MTGPDALGSGGLALFLWLVFGPSIGSYVRLYRRLTAPRSDPVNLGKFFADVEAFAPGILYAFNPALGLIASEVVALIKAAQASGQTGTQKLASVVAQAPALISTINAAEGHVVVDPALVTTVLGDAVSTVIQVVKLVNNPTQIPAVTAALATVQAPGAVAA